MVINQAHLFLIFLLNGISIGLLFDFLEYCENLLIQKIL